jgi:hypothetical protein
MPWQPSKTTAGPYVTGSVDGRLRELEAQVSELTDMLDTLRRVIIMDRAGRVRIYAERSLTLASGAAHINVAAGKITATNGFTGTSIV